ncbi:MAG: hypothetical protein K2Y71_18825 [Xanthobacteraceae bacterium]|nr:hypothetical protein [Xanthobacteraceae bacterium]
MSNGSHTVHRSIGSQWIKANAIGAVINVALTFVAFLIGQALGVNEKGASGALQTVFVLFATGALSAGLLVLGYLSGVVLRSKLPAFPMRTWLALYVVFGAVFGSVSAFAWLTPEIPTDPGPVETAVVLGLMFGAAIAGVVISTAVGSLQALILRPAASGLGRWIGCCALAGLLFALIVPAVIYGPQSGFAQELTVELVTLVVTILAAVILLPAVERLKPR